MGRFKTGTQELLCVNINTKEKTRRGNKMKSLIFFKLFNSMKYHLQYGDRKIYEA